jgi:hypothetical protein
MLRQTDAVMDDRDLPQPGLCGAHGRHAAARAGRRMAGNGPRYFSIDSIRRIDEKLEGGEMEKELLAAIA